MPDDDNTKPPCLSTDFVNGVSLVQAIKDNKTADARIDLTYAVYSLEYETTYLPLIRQLISKDLSEPYSIYVYRYFLNQWGDLCFMVLDSSIPAPKRETSLSAPESSDAASESQNPLVGVVVCKLEPHRSGPMRGYIAMLATASPHRGKGIATSLVRLAVQKMKERGADEIVLETETSNAASLKLYEKLGFIRSKRLFRYYLNGNAAFRLVLYLRQGVGGVKTIPPQYPPPANEQDEDIQRGIEMYG